MLAWTSSTPAFVLGAEDLLVKAIQALLETAVKFSDTGKTVRLACHFVPDAVNIAIESRGRDCTACPRQVFRHVLPRRSEYTGR